MLGKLKSVVKALKEHDSTLFQSNGLILKQGEEFAHDFNVKQIQCVEAKVQKVTRDTETLEQSKDSFRSIFKGLHRDISKGRRKKKTVENRMQEKRKGLKTTFNECIVFVSETRLIMIFRNVFCILLALPSLKGASTLRKFPNCFLIEKRHTLHSSCKETISATPQEAELSQTSSRRLEIMCTASCTLKSMP